MNVEKPDNHLPFDLRSDNTSSDSSASVRYLLENVAFGRFVENMRAAEEWCEFIPLHLNIKACVHFVENSKQILRFYAGTKGYQNPNNAHVLQLRFSHKQENDVFYANLFASDGPLDSSDINFSIRAIPVQAGGKKSVYLEFDLTSKPGLAANLMKIYLATVARKKVGFSIVGTRWNGKPEYVSGARGATERNIVRYLLTIETYFSTLDVSEEDRFQARTEHWYDSTDKFRKQLYEVSRKEYLWNKKRERSNQKILQTAIEEGTDADYSVTDR